MKLKEFKRLIPEIIWIVILASAFGILNNYFSSKRIPVLPEYKAASAVPDSVLNNGKSADTKTLKDISVSYEQIVKLLSSPDVIFIDARSPEQYEKGHIGHSINIYPNMENQQEYFAKINELPTDKIIIVYCDGGACDLSHELSKSMYDFGYTHIFLYKGGWEEWSKKTKK